MPVADTATANTILSGWLGTGRATGSPDSYKVRLWIDRPDGDDPSEADWGGYTPPTWDSDDWLTPEGGQIQSDGLADFGAPSSAGTDAARWWSLNDTSTDDLRYFGPLSEPLSVTASATAHVKVRLTVPVVVNI